MLLNVLVVIKFKSFQKFFQRSKEMKFTWHKVLTDCEDVTAIPYNYSTFLHGLKSLMSQIVIVLQYDTLPQQIWSISVMQTLQNFHYTLQNKCSSSILLLFHTNGYVCQSECSLSVLLLSAECYAHAVTIADWLTPAAKTCATLKQLLNNNMITFQS